MRDARYEISGTPNPESRTQVMTFMVNHNGVVYEKDLGPDTAAVAREISKFNPAQTWKRMEKEKS